MSRHSRPRDQEHRQYRAKQQQERPREQLKRLDRDDLNALRAVGAFRIMNRENLAEAPASRLISRGYVERKTLYPRKGGKAYELLSLSKKGRAQLEAERPEDDDQRYWTGAVKPREVEHDIAIYEAFVKEAQQIESEGGHVRKVALDFEFKADINSRMNKPLEPGESLADRRKEIAAEYGLPLVENKVMLPDARIQYIDADGFEQHRDIEVVTKHYRGSMRSAKNASGFRLHNAGDPRAAVRDDHDLNLFG